MTDPLAGRRAVVTGTGTLADGLAGALADAGAAVARDLHADGPIDTLVLAEIPALALERVPFEEVDVARWQGACEDVLGATLRALQVAFARLRASGRGRIVLVTPTLAMTGVAGLAPYAAAAEGQRALAKSAARQWGVHGITVNCLAPATPGLGGADAAEATSIAGPALAGPADPRADLGPAAVFLVSDAAHHVTGQTIVVDDGVWMPL